MSAESIHELYNRDPLGYSEQDLNRIIHDLREKRLAYVQADKPAKTPGKSTTATKGLDTSGIDI